MSVEHLGEGRLGLGQARDSVRGGPVRRKTRDSGEEDDDGRSRLCKFVII